MKVVEEVTSSKQLHDDLNVVLTLKHIKKPNNAGMLADLKHLDFSL